MAWQFNTQSIVANTTKQANRLVNDVVIASETAQLAWAASDERNAKLVKEQQAAALKALFA